MVLVMRLIILLLALFTSPALACGTDTDCMVAERSYRNA
jgi:hypothetical protein